MHLRFDDFGLLHRCYRSRENARAIFCGDGLSQVSELTTILKAGPDSNESPSISRVNSAQLRVMEQATRARIQGGNTRFGWEYCRCNRRRSGISNRVGETCCINDSERSFDQHSDRQRRAERQSARDNVRHSFLRTRSYPNHRIQRNIFSNFRSHSYVDADHHNGANTDARNTVDKSDRCRRRLHRELSKRLGDQRGKQQGSIHDHH